MPISEKTKALVQAAMDGAVIQRRMVRVSTHTDWQIFDDVTTAIATMLEHDGATNMEFRVRPAGQHLYHLVLKYKLDGRKRLHGAGRETLLLAKSDVCSATLAAFEPIYILHIEFDPETDGIRAQEIIGLEATL